jgi:hypothetical protein
VTEYANPLELAKEELGDQFDANNCSPVTEDDAELIMRLHIEARDNGFIDTAYWTQTEQGLVLPVSTPAKTREYHGKLRSLEDIMFAGSFVGYHKFSLGRLASWCLRFNDSTLAPGLDKMSDDEELWVPTVALQTMDEL